MNKTVMQTSTSYIITYDCVNVQGNNNNLLWYNVCILSSVIFIIIPPTAALATRQKYTNWEEQKQIWTSHDSQKGGLGE